MSPERGFARFWISHTHCLASYVSFLVFPAATSLQQVLYEHLPADTLSKGSSEWRNCWKQNGRKDAEGPSSRASKSEPSHQFRSCSFPQRLQLIFWWKLSNFKAIEAQKLNKDSRKSVGHYLTRPLWVLMITQGKPKISFLSENPREKIDTGHLSSIKSTFPVMRKLK